MRRSTRIKSPTYPVSTRFVITRQLSVHEWRRASTKTSAGDSPRSLYRKKAREVPGRGVGVAWRWPCGRSPPAPSCRRRDELARRSYAVQAARRSRGRQTLWRGAGPLIVSPRFTAVFDDVSSRPVRGVKRGYYGAGSQGADKLGTIHFCHPGRSAAQSRDPRAAPHPMMSRTPLRGSGMTKLVDASEKRGRS